MTKTTEFTRIFSPRADKAVKAISLLTNGVRYKPTEEEVDKMLGVLKEAVNDIAQLYGILPSGDVVVKDVPATKDAAEGTASEKRISALTVTRKRSAFASEDVDANVRSIPEDQLTRYATHVLARICGKFDEPEAQPKTFVKVD